MKAVILVEDDAEEAHAEAILRRFGFELLRYHSALKALDNFDEIDPDALVVSAVDFPRHWKIVTEVARATKGKSECVIVLLGGGRFDLAEADKASHLRINGVLDGLSSARERSRFERLIKRYVEVRDPRATERVAPAPWDRIDFAFTDPASLKPVFGEVETLSPEGLSFRPALLPTGLAKGMILEHCTLRVGERLIDLNCRIVRPGSTLGLAIEAIEDEGKPLIADYLSKAAERELKARSSR